MPSMEIEFDQIVFDPEVQTYCNNPKFKCPYYGHSWSCPPNAPYLEKEVLSYDLFYIFFHIEFIIYQKEFLISRYFFF